MIGLHHQMRPPDHVGAPGPRADTAKRKERQAMVDPGPAELAVSIVAEIVALSGRLPPSWSLARPAPPLLVGVP